MAQGELSLTDYWRILHKRKWVVVVCVGLVTVLTAAYLKRQPPTFRAAAKVKIETSTAITANLAQGFQSYYENPMTTESRVIESRIVAEAVARRLASDGIDQDPEAFQGIVDEIQSSVKAQAIPETNIIEIEVTGDRSQWVADIANLTAEAYIETNLLEKNKQARKVREFVESQLALTETRLKTSEDALKRMREDGVAVGTAVVVQNRIADVDAQLATVLPRLTEAHPDVVRMKDRRHELEEQLRLLPAVELDYARLMREFEVNEGTYRMMRQRLEEVRIAEAEKISNASIIERARVPGRPEGARKRFGVAVGSLLGLLLGCVLAFAVETLDTSIGTIEDVETLLQVPVLAVIPHLGRKGEPPTAKRHPWKWQWPWGHDAKDEARFSLPAHDQPHSITAEAYRIFRTNLKLAAERKVILITSSGPGEGKTSISSNLAIVAAQSGARTILVAGDLRRPELARVFGVPHSEGLAEVLQGSLPLDQVVRGLSDFILGSKFGFDETVKHPYLANLSVLVSGRLPENPAELIGSKAMQELLHTLRAKYDVIIIDAPPILPVADSLLFAPMVDGVVLVYQVGRISRAALQRAKIQLDSVGAKVLGVVLNHIQPEVQTDPHYYYYAYRKRYGGYAPQQESQTPASSSEATS